MHKQDGDILGRGQLINRLASQVGSRAEALEILTERGDVRPGTSILTPKGRKRDNMTARERALDRASKASGKPKEYYTYNKQSNRATLTYKK